jgi:hypothetical protein
MINPLTLLSTTSIPSHLFPSSVSPIKPPRRSAAKASIPNGDGDNRAGPGKHLTTTQLLTLQLALWRVDSTGRGPWGVYVDTLPAEFRPWHPLSWLVAPETPGSGAGSKSQAHEWARWHGLADRLPRSTRSKLAEVEKRWLSCVSLIMLWFGFVTSGHPDCCFILLAPRGMLIGQEAEDTVEHAALSIDVFLWAWLNGEWAVPFGFVFPPESVTCRPQGVFPAVYWADLTLRPLSQHPNRLYPARPSTPQ